MLTIFLFIVAFFALILNNNLLLFMLITELFLLGVNLTFIEYSLLLNEILGFIISIIILIMAAIETSLGLAIIIRYIETNNNKLRYNNNLKG